MNEQLTVVSDTFQPVRVENWILFARNGGHWIRDLDLAEQAALGNPRDIRTTIKGAIEDGLILTCETSAKTVKPHTATTATVFPVRTLMPVGNKGGTQEVIEFYLNEEAALLVVMRLRTPTAVQLTRAVVRAFLAVARGEIAAPASTLTAAEVEAIVRANIQAMVPAFMRDNAHTIFQAILPTELRKIVHQELDAEREWAIESEREVQRQATYNERLIAQPDPRPLIRVIPGELHRVIQQAIDAIRGDEELFMYHGRLVHVVEGKRRKMHMAVMRERLSRVARFAKPNPRKDRWELMEPPATVASFVMVRAITWARPTPVPVKQPEEAGT